MKVRMIIGILLTGVVLCWPLLAEDSDVQSKLDALEAAHEAGILTDEEYASKKAELEAQLRPAKPALDEATQQKLKALEAAHQAGVLSDEEYARKKAELLGQPAVTSLARYQDPQGRFHFQHPGDWTIQALQDGRQGVALTRGKAALNVMPLPDGAEAQQVLEGIAEQIRGQWQDYRELRRGQRTIAGVSSPLVEFTGVNPQGMRAHSRLTVLVSGIKGYAFLLIAPEDEPENSFAAIQPAWGTLLNSFTLTGEKGKTYRHAAGFSFLYPEGWTVTEQEGYLQLTPPNPSSTGEAPTELYFVVAEDISQEGIQRPDDPMVLEYLDMQIQSLSPALRRTGSVSPIDMRKGKGAVIDWEAKGTGGDVRARAFVSIINNYGVVLIAMGLKEQIEARDSNLRQMFASFGVGDPQPPLTSSTPYEQQPTTTAASPQISGNEVGDPNWGYKFQPPSGWKSQKGYKGAILGHDTIAGMILVFPHMEASFQQVQAQMQSGLAEEGVQLYLTGALQPFGNNAVAGEYAGIFDGQQVKARGVGTFSPHGGGAYIVALTTPDKYGSQLSGAADAIARGMQYFKVEVSELVRHFSGTWASATSNTLTNITLAPDGSYSDTYEASYWGDFKDDVGDKVGHWDTFGQDRSKGRWTVRGNKQQGVIVITSQDGSETVLEYRVHVEKGQTYWNEYWFNGQHYSKQR